MNRNSVRSMILALALTSSGAVADGKNVKITPLGQRTGEFCRLDRALLLEDPTGVRILYDPGNTIAGSTDARLGDVHVILITHAHTDHLGSAKLNQDPDAEDASCGFPFPMLPATPHSNSAEIAVGKNSAVIAAGPLSSLVSLRIENLRGETTPTCPAAGLGNEMTVPRTDPCTAGLGIGARRTVRLSSAERGVEITPVTAVHDDGLDPAFLTDPERASLAANNLNAYVGVANGFVLTFTNGLKVYLAGDTGLTSDMKTIVRGFYAPQLVVFNIGDIFTTGPEEAAFAVTRLIQPNGVIPSHANEVATRNGVVLPETHTARFIELLGDIPAFVPLSGVTMEFDANGQRVTGARAR